MMTKTILRSLLLLAFAQSAHATLANGTADLVIGQTGFTSHSTSLDADHINSPYWAVADVANDRLIVSDYANHRILIWNHSSALTNGATADIVLGQSDFVSSLHPNAATAASLNSPSGGALDGVGRI